MYDAIEDPYTYKSSTVLVNKLGLETKQNLMRLKQKSRTHARKSHYPTEFWILSTTRPSITIYFRTSTNGRGEFAR
jgi:hypothetical protein